MLGALPLTPSPQGAAAYFCLNASTSGELTSAQSTDSAPSTSIFPTSSRSCF